MKSKLALLILLALPLSLFSESQKEVVKKSFNIGAGGELTLKNTNGKITIETWDREEVLVEAIKKVKADSQKEAQELLEAIEIEMNAHGNELQITTDLQRKSGNGFLGAIFGKHQNVSVTYNLKVPQKFNVDIKTVNGRVASADLNGKQFYRTTNGSIDIKNASGVVSAKTTNGSIKIYLTDAKEHEDMDFSTTNGSIELNLPKDIAANIDAKTTNGKVKTDFPITVKGTLSRKKMRGKINGGGGNISLHTTNGGIRISEN